MRSLAVRQAAVALLILATGAAGVALQAQDRPSPSLPAIAALTERTQWRVAEASPPVRSGVLYRQWRLRDGTGHEALLYVGVTAEVKAMLRWSGELGYLGEGYVTVARRDAWVVFGNGRRAPVAEVTLQHLSERRTVQYAVVGPRGVGRRGLDLALDAVWDLARGAAPGYYLVRVTVAAIGLAASHLAAGLLGVVLGDLAAPAPAGAA
jgi:hypothetical protein